MDDGARNRADDDRDRSERETPLLGERFETALAYAAKLHRTQRRKGSGIPYVGHLLGVASLVLEAHGDEDQAIAALLHDAVEDQGGAATLAEIRRRFGERVADIVEICSDPWEEPTPPWVERKRISLEHLWSASADVLLVALADKLYNAQALLRDYRRTGDALWGRFRATPDQKLWFFGQLAVLFQERFPGPMSDEYSVTVQELGAEVSGLRAVAVSAPHRFSSAPSPSQARAAVGPGLGGQRSAERYRVAACQFEPTLFDTDTNLSTMERLAREAVERGAELVVFPECCLTGYGLGEAGLRLLELAEPVWGDSRGTSVRKMEELARDLGVTLCFGMPERAGDAVYDAAVTISPGDGVVSTYHKAHMHEAEGGLFARGATFQVLPAPAGRFGPLIGYDLEFPEAVRSVVALGAQLVAVSSAGMHPWEESQRTYARARAMENSAFLVLADCIGQVGGTGFFGGSVITDPFGRILAEAGTEEAVLVAEIDLGCTPNVAAGC